MAGGGQLTIYEFGRQLLTTKDLDPVYVVLWETRLPRPELERYLLAYWCYYHMGTAAWIVEQMRDSTSDVDYWIAMETAARSKEYPRAAERRHFRGTQATEAVVWLKARGMEELFGPFREPGKVWSAEEVLTYVKTWKRFGPWISFKVADVLERLGLADIRFDLATAMYDSPARAAQLLWSMEGEPREGCGDVVCEWAVHRIIMELRTGSPPALPLAPPQYERQINVQECETVLCKWGSYLKGHYHIGKDICEVHEGLLLFDRCKTAQRLLTGGQAGGLW